MRTSGELETPPSIRTRGVLRTANLEYCYSQVIFKRRKERQIYVHTYSMGNGVTIYKIIVIIPMCVFFCTVFF